MQTYMISARKIDDIELYSSTLLSYGEEKLKIVKIKAERVTSHNIYYFFIFKTSEEIYHEVLDKLRIKERRT